VEKRIVNKKTKNNRPKSYAKKRAWARSESMIFYHVTKPGIADAILKTGFRDATGNYGTDRLWSGVWLADRPLDINDTDRSAEAVLEVSLNTTEAALAEYEWVEEGKDYREWLIPAQIVNQGRVKPLPKRTNASSFNKRLGVPAVAILATSGGPGVPSLIVETSRSMRAPLTWEGMLRRAGLHPEIFPYELGYEIPGHPYLAASGNGTATVNRVLLYNLCCDQLLLARSEVETLQITTPQLVRSRREFFNYVPDKAIRLAVIEKCGTPESSAKAIYEAIVECVPELRQWPPTNRDPEPGEADRNTALELYEELKSINRACRRERKLQAALRNQFPEFKFWKATDELKPAQRSDFNRKFDRRGEMDASDMYDCVGVLFNRAGSTVSDWCDDARKRRKNNANAQ
jgi:hypothetical protein